MHWSFFISYAVHPLVPWCSLLSLWHLYIFSEQSFMVCMIVFFWRSSCIDVCLSSGCRDVPQQAKGNPKSEVVAWTFWSGSKRIFMSCRSQQTSLRCWRLGWNKRNGWISCFVNLRGWRHPSYILSSPSILPIVQQLPKWSLQSTSLDLFYPLRTTGNARETRLNPWYPLQCQNHELHALGQYLLITAGKNCFLSWYHFKVELHVWIDLGCVNDAASIGCQNPDSTMISTLQQMIALANDIFTAATRITRLNDENQQRS